MLKNISMVLALVLFPVVALAAQEEATVVHGRDGATLQARWSLPQGSPRLGVVILQGSGNVGLDGDVSGPYTGQGYRGAPAKLSDQLAARLAEAGVASLRYSKRGFDDQAQLKNQTLPYMIDDAKAALQQVKARFPAARHAFVGLSEGALVALLASTTTEVDALYLLSLPSRSIDEMFVYQFIEWPTNLLMNHLEKNASGELTGRALSTLAGGAMPIAGAPWAALDADKNGALSVGTELVPFYRQFHATVMGMMHNPPLADWYNSLRQAPNFAETAAKVKAPVYLYQATDDAQVNWTWLETDRHLFTANGGKTSLKLFSGLGHCFAPMDGAVGEVKTSGPLDPRVLEALAADTAVQD